jgi:hypothetical protein
MALGSQQANVELMAALTGLTHDIFVGKVVNNVRRESPVSMLYQDADRGEYRLEGQNMVFAVDLRFKTGALATDGNIPDHVPLDAVQGQITPVRRYARIALDNFVEKRATGPGAFEDLADRIFEKLWDAWASMEIRHAIGDSTGLIGKCDTRTSSTVFSIKDAYGNAGTNPLSNLSEGSIICWYDLTATAAIDGAAKISSIDYTNRTITVDSAATWEPGDILATDDLIYFSTTNNIATDYFTAERNLAINGLGTVVDPAAGLTTVFNIAEGTYPRWKPFRKASVTFDHLELTEHWLQLGAKRGFKVSPQSDVCVAFPSAVAQVARSLMGFQQQAYTGKNLEGGYQMVHVSGIPIMEDHFFYHNVCMTLNKDSMYRVNLGEDADFWGEDGSMWSRIADYDGKDAFVVDYLNCFCNHRGANSALTGIVTDVTDEDFTNVPSY